MAENDDVMIRGAPSFGCDDVCEIAGCDFVDDAYQAFMPAIFVILVMVVLIWIVSGGIAGTRTGEAGFYIGHSVEVEVQSKGRDLDVNLRQRFDASSLLEGLMAEVG
jgi:hypothetical protein